jgi:hypothetical protein
MEASDIMDVLHFLFEEDFTAVAEDHARSRSAIRDTLYSELYGVKYTFKMKDPAKGKYAPTAMQQYASNNEYDSLDDVDPFNPRKHEAFSPRDPSQQTGESKAKFIDSASVPLAQQSFDGLDAPLN